MTVTFTSTSTSTSSNSSSTHQSTQTTQTTSTTRSTASKSVVIYQASMQTYPTGWIVNEVGSWKYGTPTSVYDPHGFVVAGNVITGSGLYPEPITDTQILNSAIFSTLTFSNITLTSWRVKRRSRFNQGVYPSFVVVGPSFVVVGVGKCGRSQRHCVATN